MLKINKMEILNLYFTQNKRIPHIKLNNGKWYHKCLIQALNETQVKIAGHKVLDINEIHCIEIPQHSATYDNEPFCELVCKKYLGMSYDMTLSQVKYHPDTEQHIGGKHTKYLSSKPMLLTKTINGVFIQGVKTYGTLTDLVVNGYGIGTYYSNTSSKWASEIAQVNMIY